MILVFCLPLNSLYDYLNDGTMTFQNKTYILLLFIFIYSCHQKEVRLPEVELKQDDLNCLIMEAKAKDTLLTYFKALNEIDEYIIDHDLTDSLYKLEKLYQISPKTPEDSSAFRAQLCRHAQRFNKINDYKEALKFYLLSSSYASDLHTDKNVWYIENRIGGIYARMDDYDKTLYYYKLCIPYLTENKVYGTLSRLYKEIGRTYMWLGNYPEMKRYYDEGIIYGELANEFKGLQAIHEAYGDYFLNFNTDENRLVLAYKHIQNSISYLNHLEVDEDYIEREQSLDVLLGQYYNEKSENELSTYHFCKALHNAEIFYTSPKSREIAKIYHKLAHLSLHNNNLAETNNYIKKGFSKLLPGYGQKEIPGILEIDRENTFIDLLHVKSDYYHKLFENRNDYLFLDSALLSLDLAINANEQLNKKLLLNNSKYVSVATNKSLVNKAITYCYEGFEIYSSEKYTDKARTYFDLSKSIIFLENQSRNSVRTVMSAADKINYDGVKEKLLS